MNVTFGGCCCAVAQLCQLRFLQITILALGEKVFARKTVSGMLLKTILNNYTHHFCFLHIASVSNKYKSQMLFPLNIIEKKHFIWPHGMQNLSSRAREWIHAPWQARVPGVAKSQTQLNNIAHTQRTNAHEETQNLECTWMNLTSWSWSHIKRTLTKCATTSP